MRYLHSFVFFLTCCGVAFSQFSAETDLHDTLALVDQRAITLRDLFERISMMPYEDKLTDRDFESVKRKAAASLVGEVLLSAIDVRDDSTRWRKNITVSVLEKFLVRDALYKREVSGKVRISDSEQSNALRQYNVRRKVIAVKLTGEKEGKKFVESWRTARTKKKSNREILSAVSFRYDTLYISFGSADSILETAAFRLRDSLDVTGPIQSQLFGSVAVSMISEEPNPSASGKSVIERNEVVRNLLRERRESRLQTALVGSLVRGQQMRADTLLFYSAAQRLHQLIMQDTAGRKVSNGFRYVPDDVNALMIEFRTQLDSPIVRGSFGGLKLGEFLEHLYYYEHAFPSMRVRAFASSFFQLLRTISEAEMIAQEGYRRGLKYDPEVRRDLSVWTDYERSRRAAYAVVETVSVLEWEPYWSIWKSNAEMIEKNLLLNIQEILVGDSVTAVDVKGRLSQGENIDSLARDLTLREEWKGRNGNSGWFPFIDHGEIAAQAMTLSAGDISMPVRLKEGFSVFKLVGRKFITDGPFFDSLLRRESKQISMNRQNAALNAFIASEALRHRIEIFEEKLRNVDLANINMVTLRLLGFGGRMNAAPTLTPRWQWIEQWKNVKDINP